jgi:hypothetical protein
VKSSRFGPIGLGDEANHAGTSPQPTPALGWSTFRVRFFWSKKVPNLGSIPDPPGFEPTYKAFYPCTKAYKAYTRLTKARRLTQARLGVEFENQSDHGGVTLILVGKHNLRVTQVVPSPSGRFDFFDPRDSNPRPSAPKPWVRTQAYRLIRLL